MNGEGPSKKEGINEWNPEKNEEFGTTQDLASKRVHGIVDRGLFGSQVLCGSTNNHRSRSSQKADEEAAASRRKRASGLFRLDRFRRGSSSIQQSSASSLVQQHRKKQLCSATTANKPMPMPMPASHHINHRVVLFCCQPSTSD